MRGRAAEAVSEADEESVDSLVMVVFYVTQRTPTNRRSIPSNH